MLGGNLRITAYQGVGIMFQVGNGDCAAQGELAAVAIITHARNHAHGMVAYLRIDYLAVNDNVAFGNNNGTSADAGTGRMLTTNVADRATQAER